MRLLLLCPLHGHRVDGAVFEIRGCIDKGLSNILRLKIIAM